MGNGSKCRAGAPRGAEGRVFVTIVTIRGGIFVTYNCIFAVQYGPYNMLPSEFKTPVGRKRSNNQTLKITIHVPCKKENI